MKVLNQGYTQNVTVNVTFEVSPATSSCKAGVCSRVTILEEIEKIYETQIITKRKGNWRKSQVGIRKGITGPKTQRSTFPFGCKCTVLKEQCI
jgi:hypothetical protein